MAKHDIFICFSSKDESIARQVVSSLEAGGLRCWISLRNVAPGENYQEAIVTAIEASKVIVFLFSENSKKSGEIKKELSLAGAENIAVIPLRLTPVLPSGAFRYELATRQWIDAFPNLDEALGRLLQSVKDTLQGPAAITPDLTQSVETKQSPAPAPAVRARGPRKPRRPREPIVLPGSEQFEAVRSLLARHIGPIAKTLVQKTATEAKTLEEFCDRLGAYVRTPSDRETFVQAARARLAIKS
jgi:hypothetical protein